MNPQDHVDAARRPDIRLDLEKLSGVPAFAVVAKEHIRRIGEELERHRANAAAAKAAELDARPATHMTAEQLARRRARAQQLIRDLIQFGRDDEAKGGWAPSDMDVFVALAPTKRARFLQRLLEL